MNIKDWSVLASNESIQKAVGALKANGINALITENGQEAMSVNY